MTDIQIKQRKLDLKKQAILLMQIEALELEKELLDMQTAAAAERVGKSRLAEYMKKDQQ